MAMFVKFFGYEHLNFYSYQSNKIESVFLQFSPIPSPFGSGIAVAVFDKSVGQIR